jgi:hypothetical protein
MGIAMAEFSWPAILLVLIITVVVIYFGGRSDD